MALLRATSLVTLGLTMTVISVDAVLRCTKTATNMTMTFTAEKDSWHQKLITVRSLRILQTSRCESVKISHDTGELLQISIITDILSRKQIFPDPSISDCFITEGDTPTKVKYLVAAEQQLGIIQYNDKFYEFQCDSITANSGSLRIVQPILDVPATTTPTPTTTPIVETTTDDSTSIHGDRNMFTAGIIAGYVMTMLTVTAS